VGTEFLSSYPPHTHTHAFSALTLLVWHLKDSRDCKNSAIGCRRGYLSAAKCRLSAYRPVDATAIPKPHHLLPHLNPDWFYLSGTILPIPTADVGPDLQNILRQSYDNAIVTIDLRQTTNLPNRLTKGERLFLCMIHLQNCKIV